MGMAQVEDCVEEHCVEICILEILAALQSTNIFRDNPKDFIKGSEENDAAS